jgi:RimJ/RimL family protein N-acetyltransferase
MNDAKRLFDWRNDPKIYKFLTNPRGVDWESHLKWFEKLLQKKDTLFYIGLEGTQPCGIIRYDQVDNECVEIGLYLAPEYHSRGLSKELLAAGELELRKNWPRIKKIIARVSVENTPSLKMFSSDGFTQKQALLEKILL